MCKIAVVVAIEMHSSDADLPRFRPLDAGRDFVNLELACDPQRTCIELRRTQGG
jgi:hypothetical protein